MTATACCWTWWPQNKFDLGTFEIVESSEQGMLAQVARADAAGKPVVFLGWEPHPMNSQFKLTYLAGGDEIFGPDLRRRARRYQCAQGYVTECPNLGKFLQNLEFTLPMENEVMGLILNDGDQPDGRGQEMAEGQSRCGHAVAGWRDHQADGGDAMPPR
jgi:glycine betaine/proline transport system substrate-binding protein